MIKILLLALILTIQANCALAKRAYYEKYYQEKHCTGKLEYVLEDRTRVDCLTKDYAFEYDFANKWAESLGQSLYYSAMTGRKAGIVLIMENPEKDKKYLYRLRKAIKSHNLDIRVILVENK